MTVVSPQTYKIEQFRGLHIPGKPFLLFNVWDAGSAEAVAATGAKAIATSSWSVANANGFADGERIPLALAIDNLRRIVSATDLPVTIDLESGYGNTPEMVGESVNMAINAGAAGCNLEDSFPANGKLRETTVALLPPHLPRQLSRPGGRAPARVARRHDAPSVGARDPFRRRSGPGASDPRLPLVVGALHRRALRARLGRYHSDWAAR